MDHSSSIDDDPRFMRLVVEQMREQQALQSKHAIARVRLALQIRKQRELEGR